MKGEEETDNKKRNETEKIRIASLLSVDPDRPLHHGVFSHKNNRISTKPTANVLKLGGTDVISSDNENLCVRIQKLTQFLIIDYFLLHFA